MIKVMDALLLRPALFRHLKKRGIQVMKFYNFRIINTIYVTPENLTFEIIYKINFQTYVWVLNYEEEFKRAFDLGVDGVMTDFPSKLKKFLSENPQYNSNNVFIE